MRNIQHMHLRSGSIQVLFQSLSVQLPLLHDVPDLIGYVGSSILAQQPVQQPYTTDTKNFNTKLY